MNDRSSAQEMAANRLHLGGFVLDLLAGELLTAGGDLAGLRKQALDVLLVLGRRAGQVVGKDELMGAVWPNVVVGEGSLTQAIADIRRVLGDQDHRLVRSVARRGYMLVPDAAATDAQPAAAATLTELPAAATADAGGAPSALATTPYAAGAAAGWPAVAAPRVAAWRRPRIVAMAAVALALAAGGGRWAMQDRSPGWQSPSDLARVPLGKEVPPLSIIVLPLAIEGEAKDAEWLADALHGDLVIEIARLPGSLVIARDTAATYKGRLVDPRQVAREMGVRHVVQGSLRPEGTAIRINLALIDGETGAQRWAEAFQAERSRLAQAVGEFAVAIERTLAGAVWRSTVERRAALSPGDATADDRAMQGFALWYRGVTRENVLAARELFERAVSMDPDSARAWAGINFTNINVLLNGWDPDRAAMVRRLEQAAAQLERLDRDGSYTYQARTTQLFLKRNFTAMLRQTSEWTERYRLPNAFTAHGAALIFNGRFDDAVPVFEQALRLGPRDPFRYEAQVRLALAHFGAGRYELAHEWGQTAVVTNPAALLPPIHAAALHRLGRIDEAQRAFDEHLQRHPGFKAGQMMARLSGTEPAHVEMRERLLASLRVLGLGE